MMILPHPKDALHKAWMYRLLTSIADDARLTDLLRFKGGTCGAMLGILPRFSIDLDFDLIDSSAIPAVRKHLEGIFKSLGLKIDDQSKVAPQYFLKYPNKANERNTLKLDVSYPPPKNNDYEAIRFNEIDRILRVQTVPTMFANKLLALMERYKLHGSITGRDVYDIHTFFLGGYRYKREIIEECSSLSPAAFFRSLVGFVQKHVTQSAIDQDMNPLLDEKTFHFIRKRLKQETLQLLDDELKRLEGDFTGSNSNNSAK